MQGYGNALPIIKRDDSPNKTRITTSVIIKLFVKLEKSIAKKGKRKSDR